MRNTLTLELNDTFIKYNTQCNLYQKPRKIIKRAINQNPKEKSNFSSLKLAKIYREMIKNIKNNGNFGPNCMIYGDDFHDDFKNTMFISGISSGTEPEELLKCFEQ